MKNFTYRGTKIKAELLEETETHYIIGFEGDQKAIEKELTIVEEIEELGKHQYITTTSKGEKYLVSHFDKSGKPRKNGKMISRKLIN